MKSLGRLFRFHGRAGRIEWWAVVFGSAAFALLLNAMISLAAGGVYLRPDSAGEPLPLAVLLGRLVLSILTTWLQAAVSVRRAHDRGRSALGIVLFFAAYWATVLMVLATHAAGAASSVGNVMTFMLTGLYVVVVLVGLYWFVNLGFMPGDSTANSFGLPRRGRTTSA